MELLIVTGLSGAGKTRVINALEDIGFYCVDNIPPALLGSFADLCYSPAAHHGRSAIVMDSRSGKMFRAPRSTRRFRAATGRKAGRARARGHAPPAEAHTGCRRLYH